MLKDKAKSRANLKIIMLDNVLTDSTFDSNVF